MGGCLQFNLTGSTGEADWFVDTNAALAQSGKAASPQCTITISEAGIYHQQRFATHASFSPRLLVCSRVADFMAMASGKLTGMAAFMGGKMKLKGNMGLAQKFGKLIEVARKLPPPEPPKAAAPTTAAPTAAAPVGFEATRVFEQIGANLAADPALAKKVLPEYTREVATQEDLTREQPCSHWFNLSRPDSLVPFLS